jgi:hypothetical protein
MKMKISLLFCTADNTPIEVGTFDWSNGYSLLKDFIAMDIVTSYDKIIDGVVVCSSIQ